MKSSAEISDCGRFRYSLTRDWIDDDALRLQVPQQPKTLVGILLNPSTADADVDDPTSRKSIGFAKLWGCNRLVMLNLWAFRATDPERMKWFARGDGGSSVEERKNLDRIVRELSSNDDMIVLCAWGNDGAFMDRSSVVLTLLYDKVRDRMGQRRNLWCLGKNKSGEPKHPLYVPYSTERVPLEYRS